MAPSLEHLLPPFRFARLAVVAAAGALVLPACATDEADVPDQTDTRTSSPTATDTPSPTDTSTPTPPATPTGTTSPSSTATAADVPALSRSCELESTAADIERVEFAVPDGWQVEEGNCEFLDPSLEQLEEGTEPDAAISARVADADFASVSDTQHIDGEIRHVGARSGYQAVRIRGESAGQALQPQGEPVQLWLVDLDAGSDQEGGTLVLSARPSSGASFEQAAQAADRIADTIRVVPPAAEAAPIVVTRVEGGATPWAVTHDPSDGCFHLHRGGPTEAPVDEACDVDFSDGGVAGAVLSDGDLEVAAGLAPPLANLVESDAATAPYGAVPSSLEGASAFAFEPNTPPVEVRAVDGTGRAIAMGTVG